MKKFYCYSVIFTLSYGLIGCTAFQINKGQQETREIISVDKALPQIAEGIVAMKNKLDADNVKAGVYVDDIQLEINLNANATKDGKLGIAADPLSLKSLSKSTFSFDASQDTKIEDLRGSKLIIKFKSANQYNLEYLEKLKGFVGPADSGKPPSTTAKSKDISNVDTKTLTEILKGSATPGNVMQVKPMLDDK